MKKILGLDLGTNSIGWAVVNEAETANEQSSIIRLGVRVNPLTTDEINNFEKGKSITTNADRTLKRSMRRNLQRYKLRRKNLIELLKNHGFISDETILSENGNRTTFETYRLRAKAASEEISLEQFARVLLMINKKRGYKSSRKVKSTDEGQAVDSIDVAKILYNDNLTPGQYALQLLERKQKNLPDFYRSDLQSELYKVLDFQKQFYPEIITEDFKEQLNGKNGKQTWGLCRDVMKVVGIKRDTKGADQKLENYKWRVKALSQKLDLEQIAVILQEINGQIANASGYLGDISDRSKVLRLNHLTVGQYQMQQLDANPHYSLKNQVFYRQDYLDEFETIWETQAKFHKELTKEVKEEIRDVVIFYQRKLKSQKGLVSFCEFESRQIEYEDSGKKKTRTIGLKVCPKSSPLFQEFRIWQRLNDIIVSGTVLPNNQKDLFGWSSDYNYGKRPLDDEEKQALFSQLTAKEKLSKAEIIKTLFANAKEADINFKELDGNRTLAKIYNVFDAFKIDRKEYEFDSTIEGKGFEKQKIYQLWHLLYSFEGEDNELIQKLTKKFGFSTECAKALANLTFESDYSNLSAKALRKILPHLKDGLNYSTACEYAGYRHSKNSLTKEEIDNKVLNDSLNLLPKNSLRNPVVEKILNQMVNVVNGIITEYGKPDEIRIELARELKKSQTERDELFKAMNETTNAHKKYIEILQKDFGLKHVSRNDIIRYKLYMELKTNNCYKTLYSNTYIPPQKLFSKEFDIEHIIPQAKLFDDSFSNKTLEARNVNLNKSDKTAFDFVKDAYGDAEVEKYKERVENLYKNKVISKTKRDKLLMKESDIPSGFINRDLRDSQYIAKKAKEMLESIVKYVVTTTGSVTDRLREDWQLVNVMQELNWDKYDKLGLTEIEEDTDYNGNKYKIRKIKDWTKRNDHRHHAMDALTIAFTKRSFIQYLNNLNARVEKTSDVYVDLDNVEFMDLPKEQRAGAVFAIERTQLYRDDKGKLRFNPPMPLDEFRAEAKRQLENILVSIKAKNKVVTRNVNVSKKRNGCNKKVQLTPRGQLHNESIYGSYKKVVVNIEKVNASFDAKKIASVTSPRYREALLARLESCGNDPKKAFTGKNALDKNPLWLNDLHTDKVPEKVKIVTYEIAYTIRKPISPDLNVEKVVDSHIKSILEDRLKEYGGDAKQAFSNLDENPIWLNKSKGIALKRVTISGVNNVEALHSKRDKDGNLCLSKDCLKQPVDFVSTSNNHHVAIYQKPILDKDKLPQTDDNGNIKYELEENIVSFYEATSRAMLGLPIIDKEFKKDEGWQFLFTMKQNEYFVFPHYDENGNMVFNPTEFSEEWFKNPDNYAIISSNLYRVQKLTSKDYFFRHHLETQVQDITKLKGVTWKRCGLQGINGIVKVRINHIGQIVSVGEY
ncbi:MAG: type II CRISPR RNA-guided endonuclease Cas9 [Bacteroidales bacterium]|nr:type II CRISPR RNA-guided endonuclease Cas9 [Bacteroidales bacterium]